jgi:integrase
MASVVQRGTHYCVVYLYTDENGNRKQKWESWATKAEAQKRKKEIEYKEEIGSFVVPQCHTLNDLLAEYISLYGKNTWALSTYQANVSLIEHYIAPYLGQMKLTDITTRVLEQYYQKMLKVKAVAPTIGKQKNEYVTASTVRQLHKVLRNCFEQAIKWELIERNPCLHATLPKVTPKKRDIWTADVLFHAMDVCDDARLKVALNLAFACSLRMGELLGLTWDCVDISPESIESGKASIYINKELQRANREVMKTLENKDVIQIFPALNSQTTTVQLLKSPKTLSSIRKIFLPKTVAEMLVSWKAEQDMVRESLGAEYTDYNLVLAGPLGMPTESATINAALHKLIEENDLPHIVFHSLRHSSITYKLKLNGGDVKSVQGDSGHSQANMVTDVYSHILDEDRRTNAQRFEEAFYANKGKDVVPTAEAAPKADTSAEGKADAEIVAKILANPEMAALLKTLAKSL